MSAPWWISTDFAKQSRQSSQVLYLPPRSSSTEALKREGGVFIVVLHINVCSETDWNNLDDGIKKMTSYPLLNHFIGKLKNVWKDLLHFCYFVTFVTLLHFLYSFEMHSFIIYIFVYYLAVLLCYPFSFGILPTSLISSRFKRRLIKGKGS